MTINLVSLKKDVAKNDIYIKSLKKMEISTFLTEIPYMNEAFKYLNIANFEFISEITDLTLEEIENKLTSDLKTDYEKSKYINRLKNEMHSIGLIFKDEFKDTNIPENIAAIRLECIEKFPGGARAKNALYRSRIFLLGDLINHNVSVCIYLNRLSNLYSKNGVTSSSRYNSTICKRI